MEAPGIGVGRWAERVLRGTTLDDKLCAPTVVSDEPGRAPRAAPEAPGRPRGLELAAGGTARLPGLSALHDPRQRGRLLHAFANHELQALELMALALLRFPDAPAAFRRGLVGALQEEQLHLTLYLERMTALGVEFGEQPLGGFFWRVMAPMPSPLDFMAHMALTFEQANLDFARSYGARLREVGDEATAAILDRIHADEVGHVKLGLVWFERWRERGPSLFEAHRNTLRSPITPRRARGLGFDREARRQVGLPLDYVDRLAVFESSRGRPPAVHLFLPTAELELGTRSAYTPSAVTRTMTEDLETLPMFVASRQDVVLVTRAPSVAYQRTLAEVGLAVPEWVEVEQGPGPIAPGAIVHPRLAALHPWGWAPIARTRLSRMVERTEQPVPPPQGDAVLHAKTTWVEIAEQPWCTTDEPWLHDPDAMPMVAGNEDDALEALRALEARGYQRAVIKAPYGTSGRNAQRIDAATPTVPQRGWLRRTLATQGAVVVEPWLDAVADVSIRASVDAEGKPHVESVGRFITDARGQFVGAVLGPLSRAVPPAVARVLHGDGRDPGRLDRIVARTAAAVADRVHHHGHAGRVGIDGLLYRDLGGRIRLRPIVEVNVRPTMGHVVHGIARQLAHGVAGLWVMVRLADLPPGRSLAEAIEVAGDLLPTVMVGSSPRLRQGVVATTEPGRAAAVGTMLLAAHSRAEALQALRVAAPVVAARITARL